VMSDRAEASAGRFPGHAAWPLRRR